MIASRIKELREVLGLSMPAFGRRLGCSRDMIANIEYRRVEPKEVFLDHLCEIFGVNSKWLCFGEGPMFEAKDGDSPIFAARAGDEQVREAAEIFRSLSFDLRELALSQLKSLQKLMKKNKLTPTDGTKENLDTIRLMAAMLDTSEFGELTEKAQTIIPIGKRIREVIDEKGFSVEQLAEASARSVDEVNRILDSEKGMKRDALIAVSLALSLDMEETQRLLTATGLPALYAKNRRDAACLFALMKGLDVIELNALLAGLEEAAL